MGILNVTPDSFSDGGQWLDVRAAVDHGLGMVSAGAAIIDIGGESTRPGADRVTQDDELARVVPVVEELVARGITVSVDTMRSAVAEASIVAGATIINDVSGGKADPDMFDVVAASRAELVLMHWRAHSAAMQEQTTYQDLVGDVVGELLTQRDGALAAGVPTGRLVLDPGIGFSKTFEQNWALLRDLGRFTCLGHRVLLGVSRKGFLREVAGEGSPSQRDVATAAITAIAAAQGVWAVRTHEVPMQVQAAAVGARIAGIG